MVTFASTNLTFGRANYLHWIADLIGRPEKSSEVTGIDMYGQNVSFLVEVTHCCNSGTGASAIYPLLGVRMYDWNFIATEIDPDSIQEAQKNVDLNEGFSKKISILPVPSPTSIETRQMLVGVIPDDQKYVLRRRNALILPDSISAFAIPLSLTHWKRFNRTCEG